MIVHHIKNKQNNYNSITQLKNNNNEKKQLLLCLKEHIDSYSENPKNLHLDYKWLQIHVKMRLQHFQVARFQFVSYFLRYFDFINCEIWMPLKYTLWLTMIKCGSFFVSCVNPLNVTILLLGIHVSLWMLHHKIKWLNCYWFGNSIPQAAHLFALFSSFRKCSSNSSSLWNGSVNIGTDVVITGLLLGSFFPFLDFFSLIASRVFLAVYREIFSLMTF